MKKERFVNLLSDGILDVAWEGPHCMAVRNQEIEMDGRKFFGMLIQSSSLKEHVLILNIDELFSRYSSGTPLNEIINWGLKMLNLPLVGNNKTAELPQEAFYISEAVAA